MKKLLVALFLLALFLTSCSTAGGGETSGTPDTTAPEVTTEETTNETTAYKVIVDGEPSDQYEDIVIHAPTPNYLSWESEWQGEKFDIPEYKEHLLIETPRIYEVETECFVLTFDFHQKYYRVGDPMQVRITIKNKTSETLPVNYNGLDTGMIVFPDNSESRLFYEYRYYNAKYNVQQHERGNYQEPSIYYVNIPADESVDLERVYDLDPDFFERGNTYAFRYNCSCYMDGTEISIPLYAVKKTYTLIETVPDSTEPEGILLSESLGKWYFDWMPPERDVTKYTITDETAYTPHERAVAVQTPVYYETTVDGIRYEFDFFREYYKFGEAFQVRITITNETDETKKLYDMPMYYPDLSCAYVRAWRSPNDERFIRESEGFDDHVTYQLSAGETISFERAGYLLVKDEDARLEDFHFYYVGIKVPMKVVQLLPTFSAPEGSPLSSVSGDWYFDWQPFEQYVTEHEETVKGLSDAERAALIKTPTRYICESNGLTFDVIFFRETYKNGEAMQVRIAVTNHTDETVELMDFPSLSTRLVSGGGETLYADLNWMKQSERFSYYNEPTEHGMAKTTLLPEETAVFERVILLDGLETYAGDLTFEYSFGKVLSGGEYATVRVPIELVP